MQQVAAILSEIVFLLAGIKFEDYVAGVDVCSRAGQRDNLQRAATDGWSRDGPRLAGPQDSRRGNFELKINLFDGGRWSFGIRRQDGRLMASKAACRQSQGKKKCRKF